MLHKNEIDIIKPENPNLPFFVKLDFDGARMDCVSVGLFDEDMLNFTYTYTFLQIILNNKIVKYFIESSVITNRRSLTSENTDMIVSLTISLGQNDRLNLKAPLLS